MDKVAYGYKTFQQNQHDIVDKNINNNNDNVDWSIKCDNKIYFNVNNEIYIYVINDDNNNYNSFLSQAYTSYLTTRRDCGGLCLNKRKVKTLKEEVWKWSTFDFLEKRLK
jgi:hypothetical protein